MALTLGWGVMDVLREAKYHDVSGKRVLMLGRQIIFMSPYNFIVATREYGIEPLFCGGVKTRRFGDVETIDAVDMFRMLGYGEVLSLDISDYEDADIIFDLTCPLLPEELENSFDYIIDGGTLEHTYNVPNVLANITKLLRLNGKVMHIVPANNSMTHGLYTFSPNLLTSFYEKNGFDVIDSRILVKDRNIFNQDMKLDLPCNYSDYMETSIDCRLLHIVRDGTDDFHGLQTYNKCIAQKKKEVEVITSPVDYPGANRGCLPIEIFIEIHGLRTRRKGTVAIWGCGATGRRLAEALGKVQGLESVAGFLDSASDFGEFCDLPVLSKEAIKENDIEMILIASLLYEQEIYQQIRHLEEMGIEIHCTKWYFDRRIL